MPPNGDDENWTDRDGQRKERPTAFNLGETAELWSVL